MAKRDKLYQSLATQTIVGLIHCCFVLLMGFVGNKKNIECHQTYPLRASAASGYAIVLFASINACQLFFFKKSRHFIPTHLSSCTLTTSSVCTACPMCAAGVA